MPDLTTLAAVKAFLALTTTAQDALISSLIPRESRTIEAWTGRRFPAVTNTLRRLNGTGTSRLTLPDTPILSISHLSIDGDEIPASADGVDAGYVHDDTTIYLIGYSFPQRAQCVVCSWLAGYVESETDFIPAGNTPTLTPSNGGTASVNISVTDVGADALMTQVGNAPVAGQYSFAAGVYTFNAANSGNQVTMAYQYVPGPVEQACIEMIGIDLKQRDNLGVRSKTLANESISYSDRGMSASAREMLQPFRKVTPT
jgi:hypothetical protein